jgi:hypothetical protein
MRRFTLNICLAVFALGWTAVPGQAATIIAVDAGYYRFGFETVGQPVTARPAADGLLASDGSPFTFTALDDVVLTVVDLQLSVDRFEVTITESVLGVIVSGLTSLQTGGGSVLLDVSAALADARFSRGIYYLGPGEYTVGILLHEGDILPGSGAIGVSRVPEPVTLALLGLGLGAFGLLRRRH